MGLIDILTHYDTRKKAAHAVKTAKHGVRSMVWCNPFSVRTNAVVITTQILVFYAKLYCTM